MPRQRRTGILTAMILALTPMVAHASAPDEKGSRAEVTIKGNQFSGTADEQILLDQGRASVVENTISGPGNSNFFLFFFADDVFYFNIITTLIDALSSNRAINRSSI